MILTIKVESIRAIFIKFGNICECMVKIKGICDIFPINMLLKYWQPCLLPTPRERITYTRNNLCLTLGILLYLPFYYMVSHIILKNYNHLFLLIKIFCFMCKKVKIVIHLLIGYYRVSSILTTICPFFTFHQHVNGYFQDYFHT